MKTLAPALALRIWLVFGTIMTWIQVSGAAIITGGCWKGDFLMRGIAGSICFVPGPSNGASAPACASNIFNKLLHLHIDSTVGFSIAYYNADGDFLGSANWSLPQPLSTPVFICMSGAQSQGYLTLCRAALHDDDQLDENAHAQECAIDAGQNLVRDSCYSVTNSAPTQLQQPTGLDRPSLVHAFFVLGALVTVGAILGFVLHARNRVGSLRHTDLFFGIPSRFGFGPVFCIPIRKNLPWRLGQRPPVVDAENRVDTEHIELSVIVETPRTPNIRAV